MRTLAVTLPGNTFRDYDYSLITVDKDVATVRLTAPKKVKNGNGYDEGGTYIQYLRTPRGIDKNKLAWAIEYTVGVSNCRCMHDCCGCRHDIVTASIIGNRRMKVTTCVRYNY